MKKEAKQVSRFKVKVGNARARYFKTEDLAINYAAKILQVDKEQIRSFLPKKTRTRAAVIITLITADWVFMVPVLTIIGGAVGAYRTGKAVAKKAKEVKSKSKKIARK